MKRTVVVFALAAGFVGCEGCEDRSAPRLAAAEAGARDASPPPVPSPPPLPPIRGKPRAWAAGERTITLASLEEDAGAEAERVVAMRTARARISGAPEELAIALGAATAWALAEPRVAERHIVRASVLLDLRRTTDAEAERKTAGDLGAASAAFARVAARLDWDAGHYGPAMDRFRLLGGKPDALPIALADLGWLEGEVGNLDDSERAFERAEDALSADDALLLAEIEIARARIRLEHGKAEEAEAFLRVAIARAPEHTRAHALLADALAAQGKRDDAFASLEPLLEKTRDPSLLAIAAHHAPAARAAQLRARAQKRFDEIYAKEPDAVQLDAAEFALDAGDAKRARTLLDKETAVRPTARSFEALARAQLALGDATGARASIEHALHSPLRCARIDATASRVFAKLGDTGKAGELAARARRLDPTVSPSSAPGRGD